MDGMAEFLRGAQREIHGEKHVSPRGLLPQVVSEALPRRWSPYVAGLLLFHSRLNRYRSDLDC